MFVRVLLFFFIFTSCKTTNTQDAASGSKAAGTAKTSGGASSETASAQTTTASAQPPQPMTSVPPVPPPTDSTQTPVNSGFANISFQDMGGFDAPVITITIPKDSTITSDQFKVEYKACPLNPEATLPDALKSCVEGYNRDLQFTIPVFTQSYSLQLQLCDDEKCYNDESTNIESTRFLSASSAGPNDFNIASKYLQVEQMTQDIFVQAASLHSKLIDVVQFLNNCTSTLTPAQISTVELLANSSQKALEEELLSMPLTDLEPLLSVSFKQDQITALKQVKSSLGTFQSLFDNVFILTTAGVSTVLLFQDVYGFYAWRKEINSSHKVTRADLYGSSTENADKEITLAYDTETGFLIDPQCKKTGNCTYYLEDPDTKKPIRNAEGKLYTIDPKEANVKYSNGHFYVYDYVQKSYIFLNIKDQPATGFAKQLGRLNPTLHYREYALLRQTGDQNPNKGKPDFKSDGLAIGKHPQDYFKVYDSTTDLETYLKDTQGPRASTYKDPVTLQSLLGMSNSKDSLSFKAVPGLIHSSIRPLLAIGSAGASLSVFAGEMLKTQTSSLGLAQNTDICTKGVSTANEMQKVAQDRTQMSILNIQIASLQGQTVQAVPKSALTAP